MKKEFHFFGQGRLFMACLILFLSLGVVAKEELDPVWGPGISIEEPRSNPLGLGPAELLKARQLGQWHTQYYPITVTGLLPPIRPIKKTLENDFRNPLIKLVQGILNNVTTFKSLDALMVWLGLNPYPKSSDTGIYQVFVPEKKLIDHRIGMGTIERYGVDGFTISCAVCHSSSLFGKTVLGLTNRFPRANEFFLRAAQVVKPLPAAVFQAYTFSSKAETQLYRESQKNLRAVGARKPQALGLDTSLAQVALSLQMRNADEWATKNSYYESSPRPDYLEDYPADSKPAVWWNVKYKNRWLSDGSVVSGNPIVTNILWNEIGRGTDLKILDNWISKNQKSVDALTAAVFSSEAPRITDFFSEAQIDVDKAKRGEKLFNESCSRCHGVYHKNWSLPGAEELAVVEKIKTFKVEYKKQTPIRDVGTDSYRYLGMKSLEKLNELQISKNNGIVIQAQKGYVPPPLVGIWARWPYFHNNSVPNLCELLTPSHLRKKEFYQGPAVDKTKDFDFECNGYPAPEVAPMAWKNNPELKYDTRIPGMGNSGHDEKIFIEGGREFFSAVEKKEIIHFLQTL